MTLSHFRHYLSSEIPPTREWIVFCLLLVESRKHRHEVMFVKVVEEQIEELAEECVRCQPLITQQKILQH